MIGSSLGRRSSGGMGRLLMALIVAGISLFSFFASRSDNPVTGETQHVSITPDQEIAMGLQAAPEMAQEYGGESSDQQATALVQQVGERVVANSAAARSPYQYEFHLLADPQTVNAFALPGGQVFITEGLFRLLQNEGELGGVLGHEVGHVVARHSAEQIAKQQLTQGLTGAAVIASYDPSDPSTQRTAQVALLIGQLINLKYGRDDELEADGLGVCFMNEAGYDPQAMIEVMQILEQASNGQQPPEFFSTHPNPQNRIERINEAIANLQSCP